MIDQKFAREQVQRLAQLDNYPRHEQAALLELITAAMIAETEVACVRAMDSFLFDGHDCPKPADIRRCINEHNERILEGKQKPKCPECDGIGFKHKTLLVTRRRAGEYSWTETQELTTDVQIRAVRAALKPEQEIYEASAPCHCHAQYAPSSDTPRRGRSRRPEMEQAS